MIRGDDASTARPNSADEQRKLRATQLFNHLFEACNILRGPINQDEFKAYVIPALPQASNDSLNFRSENPKLMTYHSAKGLQFETVILPMFVEAKSQAARKALYVAMTRTYRNLYVMYTGKLGAPLSNVPDHLYIAKESV